MVVAGERFEAAKQYRGSKRAKDNANNKLNILLVRCIFSPSFYNMLVNVYQDHRNHPLKYKLQKFNKKIAGNHRNCQIYLLLISAALIF